MPKMEPEVFNATMINSLVTALVLNTVPKIALRLNRIETRRLTKNEAREVQEDLSYLIDQLINLKGRISVIQSAFLEQ